MEGVATATGLAGRLVYSAVPYANNRLRGVGGAFEAFEASKARMDMIVDETSTKCKQIHNLLCKNIHDPLSVLF